jgi:uncharacterized membrane protein YphA (DoxX/SURF4 family)
VLAAGDQLDRRRRGEVRPQRAVCGEVLRLGYPSWFRFVVGSGEIVGAVLLLVPRRRFLGAALLGVILVGAIVTHIVNQDPLSEAVMAPTCLALVSIVALASRDRA